MIKIQKGFFDQAVIIILDYFKWIPPFSVHPLFEKLLPLMQHLLDT